jgi:hypothetical protein
MAHFAEIDSNNVVKQVIVVNNEELLDNGIESEAKGIAFCKSLFGGEWVQTSYNGNKRVRFAGIGYTYDATRDAFLTQQPYPSWVINEETTEWEAPTPYPEDGKKYGWFEPNQQWIEITTN